MRLLPASRRCRGEVRPEVGVAAGGPGAVDEQVDARYVAGVIAGKVQGGGRDLLGGGGPPERDAFLVGIEDTWNLPGHGRERGVGEARRYRVDPYAGLGQFERAALGQHGHAGLGRAVGGPAEHRNLGVQRGHVQDGSAATAAGHQPPLMLHGQEHACEAHSEDEVPVVLALLDDGTATAEACHVERAVQRAEPPGLGDQSLDVGLDGDIGPDAAELLAEFSAQPPEAPSASSRRTIASPIPEAPPVTTATLAANLEPSVIALASSTWYVSCGHKSFGKT